VERDRVQENDTARRKWAVLGAGSWGTVLAVHLARAGNDTVLWTRRESHYHAMRASRRNEQYAPDLEFPARLTLAPDLQSAMRAADDILIAVPSEAFASVVLELSTHLEARHRIVWATKGLEHGSGKLLHEFVSEAVGDTCPTALVSGPSFASEVARELPCAVVVASPDIRVAHEVARALKTGYLMPFTSTDLVGVEIGGATKNVIAVAAGISDGMGLGSNARAALITRGLKEIMDLGHALGGQRDTFMGLSGLGDLVLTCSDDQSRNRRFGLALGHGEGVQQARDSIGQVVEGIAAARTIHRLSVRERTFMPICNEVYQVIYNGRSPLDAVRRLLSQPPQPEFEWAL
jgi:glycerol-3-phosphate dehydrogenase (NAD(P)+)